jgi:hypothetical protein
LIFCSFVSLIRLKDLSSNFLTNNLNNIPTFPISENIDVDYNINNSNSWVQVISCYEPTDNFDQIWLFPRQNSTTQSTIHIDQVEVVKDTFTAGIDQTIACGTSVTLGDPNTCGITNTSYQWMAYTNLSGTGTPVGGNTPSIAVSPSQNTYYILTRDFVSQNSYNVQFDPCAEQKDTVFVEVLPTSSNFITTLDSTICAGDSTQLLSNLSNIASYSWNTGQTTANIYANQVGWHTLTAIDVNGCLYVDSIYIDQDSSCCLTPVANAIQLVNATATDLYTLAGVTAPNSIIAQDIIVVGTLTIDQDLTLENCDVYLYNNAKIELDQGVTFTATITSVLQPCLNNTQMWDGVYVNDISEKVVIERSTLISAEYAIHSENNGLLEISDSYFYNNFIGVFIHNGANHGFINGNVFEKNATLMAPHNITNYSFGVSTHFVDNFTVGDPTWPQPNVFDNMVTGIGSQESFLKIFRNRFQNMSQVGQVGVAAFTNPSNPSPYPTKVGGGSFNASNEFIDCWMGVFSHKRPLSVLNNTFQNGFRAVLNSDVDNTYMEVLENDIQAYNVGITAFNSKAPISIQINNNNISNGKQGIVVENPYYPINSGWINTHINRNCIDNQLEVGIRVTTHTHTEVVDNFLNDNTVGIQVQNCIETHLRQNMTLGSGIGTTTPSIGIDIDGSTGNLIHCNYMSNANHDMYVRGASISELKNNIFDDAACGITFDNAVIGPQGSNGYPNDNRWIYPFNSFFPHTYAFNGTDGNLSPFIYRSSGIPFEPIYNDFQTLGSFPIASFSNTLAPSPYQACFPIDAASMPCAQGVLGPSPTPIILSPEMEEELALDIISQQIDSYNEEMTQWLKEESVYRAIKEDSVQSVELQAFEDSVENSEMGRIIRVEEEAQEENYDLAESINDSITPINIIESTTQEFNDIWLTNLKNGGTADSLSSGAVDSLRSIAYLCPYEYGRSVYAARSICRYLDTAYVSYRNTCEDYYNNGNARLAMEEKATDFLVYPNPSTDFIQISCPDDATYYLQLRNSLGEMVLNENIQSEQPISVTHLNAAVYTVQVLNSSHHLIESQKLIIFR